MDRQLASQDRARWPGRALAWLSGRMTDCARGVMLGALAIAEAVLMHPVLFVLAIGARLVITERAVAKHTASIFVKLGLQQSEDDNRRVLAVLAYLGG